MGTRNPIRQANSLNKYATRFETGSDISGATDPIAGDVTALQAKTEPLSDDGGIYAGAVTGQFRGNVQIGATPASATATGAPGQIIFAASGIYLCTATNVWVFFAPGAWPTS